MRVKELMPTPLTHKKPQSLLRHVLTNKYLYIMLLPAVAYYIIFCYLPMYGVTIAFKEINLRTGLFASPWAADPLKYFRQVFGDQNFWRSVNNTFIISFMKLVVGFPVPILIALFLTLMMNKWVKRLVQTVIYLPRFISWVIIGGLMVGLFSVDSGTINMIRERLFGLKPYDFLTNESTFRWLLTWSDVWKGAGFGSIIYIAALSAINPELYEAASVEGAGWVRQMWHITLPGIKSTISVMLIMNLGNILNANFDQVFALYNTMVYSVADIIDTYVYRMGILSARYSYSSAVGLFKSVIATVFICGANFIIKHFLGEDGLF